MIKVEKCNVEVVGELGDIMTELGLLVASIEARVGKVVGQEKIKNMVDAAIKAGRESNKHFGGGGQ